MFDLEHSITEWRGRMHSVADDNPDILNELESHLREDWERRVQAGESGEKAFEEAVRAMGQPGVLRHEFAKLGGIKKSWLTKLKGLIARNFALAPSFSTFTPGALWAMELARQQAPRLNHGFIGTEHVLLGLLALEDGMVPNILTNRGVDRVEVIRQIHNWIDSFPTENTPARFPYTPRVRKSLLLAATEARNSRTPSIGAEHLLLGLVLEGNGVAGRVLKSVGLSPEAVRNEISREVSRKNSEKMDEHLKSRLRFLQQAGTEHMPHSEVGLFDHLVGTRQLLVDWKARPALCDAGLFHSIYSTQHYELKALPLSKRSEMQQLIGNEAESLVWLFCMMRQESLYQNLGKKEDFSVQHRITGEWIPLTHCQFHDLITLAFANCLEAYPRCTWSVRRNIRGALRHFRSYAMESAQFALGQIEVPWWMFWK